MSDEAAKDVGTLWADPPGFIGWFRALQNDAVGGRNMATASSFLLRPECRADAHPIDVGGQ
ncbi:MAG: hypothetical protein R2932_30745 [Caldilineaceae bacterium]